MHISSICQPFQHKLYDSYKTEAEAFLSSETGSQCLKITEKVAFNIASEASYIYILSGQKFIKNAKK